MTEETALIQGFAAMIGLSLFAIAWWMALRWG